MIEIDVLMKIWFFGSDMPVSINQIINYQFIEYLEDWIEYLLWFGQRKIATMVFIDSEIERQKKKWMQNI